MFKAIDFRFTESDIFRKEWKRLGYSEENYIKLTDFLMDHPGAGNMIPGTGGVIKLRWSAPENRGRSGGSRVIYYARDHHLTIFFLMVYSKSAQTTCEEIIGVGYGKYRF